jgi:MIP family channel proteins
VGVAFAHGLALMVIVYCWGSVSGAHVNPAVTFGVVLAGRMNVGRAILYWIVQFAGGFLAALLLTWLLTDPNEQAGMATIGRLTLSPGDWLKVAVLEGILTYFLVTAVFASGVHGRNGNMAGMAIGLVLTMDILAGGPLTGASMNPARTVGPAIVLKDYSYVWMYILGQAIGGGLAGLIYDRIFLPANWQAPVEAASRDKRRA